MFLDKAEKERIEIRKLKKRIRAASNFIAFIPSRSSGQIMANFSGVEF